MQKVLLVGESWVTIVTHQKGFDSFSTVEYTVSADSFKESMRSNGWEVSHIPDHLIETEFPTDMESISRYDAVVLSDVGSNTFLLPKKVFIDSEVEIDRLALLADYVRAGGGLVMVGGYLSFSGIENKARYGRTALADVLPVHVLDIDDRVETPAGVSPELVGTSPIDLGPLGAWPRLLGYNQTKAKTEADVLVRVDDDPLIVTQSVGRGRAAVFTSDLAPHWLTPEFEKWPGYGRMWNELISWVSGSGPAGNPQ